MSTLEIVAAASSFLGIWLTSKRWILCWPVTLVACLLYFKVFLDARLYADMVLQAIFAVAVLYGWVSWARGRGESGPVEVVPMAWRQALAWLSVGAIGGVAIGLFTSRFTDAALPWMDAGLTSFSLVGQLWTARRHAESWLVWIAVDILYVGMFVTKGLMVTAVLYAAMAGLAVLGYWRWRQAWQLRAQMV